VLQKLTGSSDPYASPPPPPATAATSNATCGTPLLKPLLTADEATKMLKVCHHNKEYHDIVSIFNTGCLY
jgi:hypothetical protein